MESSKKYLLWVGTAVLLVLVGAIFFLMNDRTHDNITGESATPDGTENIKIQSEVSENAIHTAIMENNRDKYFKGDIKGESHVVLAAEHRSAYDERNSDTVVVYIFSIYHEYVAADSDIKTVSGGATPAALTFSMADNGEYKLEEYWEPRPGNLFDSDMKEKFPASVYEDLYANGETFSENLEEECRQQALLSVESGGQPEDFQL